MMINATPSETNIEYQSFRDDDTPDHSINQLQQCPFWYRLFCQRDKRACFAFLTFISAIICLFGCIMGIVFLPAQPRYSLCNENIHWNSILNSILKLGYTQANVTIHTSLYNPNRFDIELKQLDLQFFYKNAYFGYAKVSHDQSRQFASSQPIYAIKSALPLSLFHDHEGTELVMPFQTGTPDETTRFEGDGDLNFVDSGIQNWIQNDFDKNQIALFERDQHYQSRQLEIHYGELPRVVLEAGKVTDIFLDAIIEPTMGQAGSMLIDYTNSNLFISIKCHYDTSVFAWYTPRINYNATSTFNNIDVSGGGSHGDGDVDYCLCPDQEKN